MDNKEELIKGMQQLYIKLKDHSSGLTHNSRLLAMSKARYLSDVDRLFDLAVRLHDLDADAVDLHMLGTTMNHQVANLANNHSESKQTISDLMDKATVQIRIDLFGILEYIK